MTLSLCIYIVSKTFSRHPDESVDVRVRLDVIVSQFGEICHRFNYNPARWHYDTPTGCRSDNVRSRRVFSDFAD